MRGFGQRFGALALVAGLAVTGWPPMARGEESDSASGVDLIPPPGSIALTFDDGPFEEWTPLILEILARYDIKATFFISAYRLPSNSAIVRQIVDAGHSVQSHGYHHERLSLKTPIEIYDELQQSIDLILAAGAPRPVCFRPPYGDLNQDVIDAAHRLGLEVVMWTANSLDYVYQEPDGIIEATLAGLKPGDVLLMHDHWAPAHEIALPIVIETELEQGIRFAPICIVTEPIAHRSPVRLLAAVPR